MEFRSAKSAARAEKNLQRGEEWALKALDIEPGNALIPYFLATEIYKPQERWDEMANMLNEAEKRNAEQKLEKPIILDPDNITKETLLLTVGQGVQAYREEAWTMIFNQAIELMNSGTNEIALGKLELCLKMDSSRPETYNALVGYYAEKGDLETARSYVQTGLDVNPTAELYEINAKLLQNQKLLKDAEGMYLKAMSLVTDDEKILGIKKQLIFVYIDMNDNQKAIDISNELLDIYYDDPDLYFNVGVLYQRLATKIYDDAASAYLAFNNGDSKIDIPSMYNQFKECMSYGKQSKEKFLEANDLETEDTGSREAAAEMRKLVKQIKEIYLPSIEEMAKNEGINLN
tara:strand:- start:364 stop:1401 length:1038 start_codon:yes stop_codon:yes gene_type:complete